MNVQNTIFLLTIINFNGFFYLCHGELRSIHVILIIIYIVF